MGDTERNLTRLLQSRVSLTPRRLLRRSALASPIELILNGYLVEQGWHRSYRIARPVDRRVCPLPW